MKKIIPISLFILVTFGSCETLDVLNELLDAISDEPYHDLTEDQRPIFKKGDTFYYYSEQTGLYDTLTINKISYRYWDSDKKYYQEATIQYKNNNENICFSYSATKQCILSAGYRADTLWVLYDSLIRFGENGKEFDIQINDKNYRAFNLTPYYSSDYSNPSAPYCFTYSFKYGLLEYTYENGIVYRIVNPTD